jgi:hypothetical protein
MGLCTCNSQSKPSPTRTQGEDVVAGIRTPLPISALSQAAPALYQELRDITAK